MERMLIFRSGSVTRSALSKPWNSGKSAVTKMKASGWNANPRTEEVLAAPLTVMAALAAGATVTFWKGPLVMMEGEMLMVPLPEPSELNALVTTKLRRYPVERLFWGLTANTPANWITSPLFKRRPTAAVQPVVTMLDPVCPAVALTVGVPP